MMDPDPETGGKMNSNPDPKHCGSKTKNEIRNRRSMLKHDEAG